MLKRILRSAVAAGVAAVAAGAVGLPGRALVAQAPEFETTRIADGVYQFRFRGHNGFFVVTDGGVVAVDPIAGEAARPYAAEIKRVAPDGPLRAIVYSHDHADHASGAGVLREAMGSDAPIIAHAKAAAPIRERNSADQPAPDLTFNDKLMLHFGGRTVELHHLGANHSDNSLVVLVPDVKVAFAVDFVSHDRVGYRELGSHHFPAFFESLERLQALDFERIVFGHGPAGDKASIARQVQYYSDLRRAVERAVEQGWTEDQAAERIELPAYGSWGGYGDWFALNVRGMYRWVAAQGR